jgi:hypothetical protein
MARRVVGWRPTWREAVEEALRRQELCARTFGAAPHRWVLTVRSVRSPQPLPRHTTHRRGWVLIFDTTPRKGRL